MSIRTTTLLIIVLVVWGTIALRLVHIQAQYAGEFAERGTRQRRLEETLPARPGDIFDRSGRLLATSVISHSVYANPTRIKDPDEAARQLAASLDLDSEELLGRLLANRTKQFVWVKRRISTAQHATISRLDLDRESFGIRQEYLRVWPQGEVAAHVLGMRDIDGIGQGGIEQQFDHLLRGTPGKRIFDRDASGRLIEVRTDEAQAPLAGKSLRLTLESVIQLQTEHELEQTMREWQPKSACAIVIDPQTSEILAMASRPTYNPNHPEEARPDAWINTAIASAYEPGSTFKPFLVAWGLHQGLLEKDETFHCEWGKYRMGRRLLHDHHAYGDLSLVDVLVKSSNIGMAKIGERLTNEKLFEASHSFGFGRKTGITLPSELEGTLYPLDKWTSYSTGSIPMGQELTVTPIQLITAHAALASDGIWRSPQIVREILAPTTTLTGRDEWKLMPHFSNGSVVANTVSPEVANWIVNEPMQQVVERGTGKNAKIDGLSVFGKTGTAQKVDPATGKMSHSRHVCSFIGGAPAENPRVLVLVVVDEPSIGSPHYGGTVAAPAAREILRESLRILGE